MYITTFYSFKGGVGRSMGLVNVAIELIKRGKNVLLVDFDLEAPGLNTFSLNESEENCKGIVDFVNSYLLTGESPDIRDYISECTISKELNGGNLWLMPAGLVDNNYSRKLSNINWRELYAQHQGFLLFEDIKAQWKEFYNPDYVLIDSRTGHTDISGICTRQLPDSIVFLFFPNQQNLDGLTKIVERVDEENNSRDKEQEKIVKHFVTSNVPDLDDENNILEERLMSFSKKLNYKKLTCTIHRYNSLSLLNQVIFTFARPKTRLAKEYRHLADEIVSQNIEDVDAAKQYLEMLLSNIEKLRGGEIRAVNEKLSRIQEAHSNKIDILGDLATIKVERGDYKEAYSIITSALNKDGNDVELLLRQAAIGFALGERDQAYHNILKVLDFKYFDYSSLIQTVNLLSRIDKAKLSLILDSKAILTAEPEAVYDLAESYFSSSYDDLIYAEKLLYLISSSQNEFKNTREFINLFILNSIGRQNYQKALSLFPRRPDNSSRMNDIFNYAIAEWGESNKVPYGLFELFVEKTKKVNTSDSTVNFKQCLALSYWVIGDNTNAKEFILLAKEQILESNLPSFSCWSYLLLYPEDFLNDLKEMNNALTHPDITLRIFRSMNSLFS